MSVIDSSLKFVGINPDFPTAERKSAQVNAAQEVVTMQDIIDTVNNSTVNNNEFPPDPLPLTFVDAATISAITPVPNYDNGDDGVGATLIGGADGALNDGSGAGKIDSYTLVVGSVVLIKNQVASTDPALNRAFQNGLYIVDEPGNSTTPYQLTRLADYDSAVGLYPLQINVLSGNSNKLKYFVQTTVNPEIGVSNLIFPVSALQPTLPQIAFIDTVIDTPLDDIFYANGSSLSSPGSGATLTSTVNGALGTHNGLYATINNNDINGFRRVLLINQANDAYNGDYSVVLAGSSSSVWQLRRIQTGSTGFDRYSRFFVVSNPGSTKVGKTYFTERNATPLTNAAIGTAPINIVEYGGGIPTLQQVLNNNHELVDGNNFQGTDAGRNNDGVSVIAIGTSAAEDNQGDNVVAIGEGAANGNQTEHVNAIGYYAGKANEGNFLNAIGWQAGYENIGNSLIAIGKDTGNNNRGDQVIALGTSAARNNEGDNVFAVGQNAGEDNPLSNQFIIANSILPSYANYAAASTAISATGSVDCTYMFYDESDHTIKGIRL